MFRYSLTALKTKSGLWIPSLLAILGYAAYIYHNNLHWYHKPIVREQLVKQREFSGLLLMLQHKIADLKSQLQTDPHNLNTWQQLANLYTLQTDYDQASNILWQAYQHFPAEQTLWQHILITDSKLTKGLLSPKSLDLLKISLHARPDDPVLRNIKAMHQYCSGEVAAAITEWRELLMVLPATDPAHGVIAELLAKAEARDAR